MRCHPATRAFQTIPGCPRELSRTWHRRPLFPRKTNLAFLLSFGSLMAVKTQEQIMRSCYYVVCGGGSKRCRPARTECVVSSVWCRRCDIRELRTLQRKTAFHPHASSQHPYTIPAVMKVSRVLQRSTLASSLNRSPSSSAGVGRADGPGSGTAEEATAEEATAEEATGAEVLAAVKVRLVLQVGVASGAVDVSDWGSTAARRPRGRQQNGGAVAPGPGSGAVVRAGRNAPGALPIRNRCP